MLEKQSTRSTEFDTQLFGFDSQRKKVIEEKQKLHDLLTDKMLFLVKRGRVIISIPEKQNERSLL